VLPFPFAFQRSVALIIQMTCRPALKPSRPGKLSLSKERWQSQAKGSVFLKLLALTLASLALSKPEAYGAKAVALCKYKEMQASLLNAHCPACSA
jgi:hypothetical protein